MGRSELRQKDIRLELGDGSNRNLIANFSIALDSSGAQREVMLTVGVEKGDMLEPSLEAVYLGSGALDLQRPSVYPTNIGLVYDSISVPANVNNLLETIRTAESKKFKDITVQESDGEDRISVVKRVELTAEEKVEGVQTAVLTHYPIKIQGHDLFVRPSNVTELFWPRETVATAADE